MYTISCCPKTRAGASERTIQPFFSGGEEREREKQEAVPRERLATQHYLPRAVQHTDTERERERERERVQTWPRRGADRRRRRIIHAARTHSVGIVCSDLRYASQCVYVLHALRRRTSLAHRLSTSRRARIYTDITVPERI